MFTSVGQIKRGNANQQKTDEHYDRLENDKAYAENYDRMMDSYEKFCEIHGYP